MIAKINADVRRTLAEPYVVEKLNAQADRPRAVFARRVAPANG
jgi:hypothetical protein